MNFNYNEIKSTVNNINEQDLKTLDNFKIS